jgi:flavorubredoxin
MFTYLEEDKILFPCDGFASHFCDERLFDDRVGNFDRDMKYYFDHIMGPFKEKIREGCKKVRELELSMICPSHGPILRTDPWKYVERYEEWSKDIEKSGKEAAIFYVSAYGCTAAMAQSISDGMRKASGFAIHLVNVAETQPDRIMEILERSDAVLLGSPTINKDALKPIWDTISCIALINGNGKGKKWGVFGSYGWSGEATKFLQERLKSMKLDVVEDRVTAILVPNDEELGRCRDFGERFAREVLS